MAYLFGDGFDRWGSLTDMAGWWTSVGQGSLANASQTAFGMGQALNLSNGSANAFITAWGSNEPTIFFSIRLRSVYSGLASNYAYLSLLDGSAAQMTMRFNQDGSVGFYTGGPGGALIGSIPAGAFAINVWSSMQGRVVVHNTAGLIEIRLNGATSNSYAWTNVNTRGGTTGAFATGLSVGCPAQSPYSTIWQIDDLYVASASGPAPNSRAVQRL